MEPGRYIRKKPDQLCTGRKEEAARKTMKRDIGSQYVVFRILFNNCLQLLEYCRNIRQETISTKRKSPKPISLPAYFGNIFPPTITIRAIIASRRIKNSTLRVFILY